MRILVTPMKLAEILSRQDLKAQLLHLAACKTRPEIFVSGTESASSQTWPTESLRNSQCPYKPKIIAEENLPKQRQNALKAAGQAGKVCVVRCAQLRSALYPIFRFCPHDLTSCPHKLEAKSIWHRENQDTVVRLIGQHSQIRELVNGNTELRRATESESASRLKRIRNSVDDGNRLAGRINGDNAAGLRINRQ